MPEDYINIFSYSILLPMKEGFQVFVWSNKFYFTHHLLLLLSIPLSITRFYQVINKRSIKYYGLLEIGVWLFRLLQYSLIVFIGNDLSMENIFSKHEWSNIIQGFHFIDSDQLIWDLIGYAIIFGMYNILLLLVISKKWTKKAFPHHTHRETIHSAIILGFNNLFLIPVGVIYLLNIIKII